MRDEKNKPPEPPPQIREARGAGILDNRHEHDGLEVEKSSRQAQNLLYKDKDSGLYQTLNKFKFEDSCVNINAITEDGFSCNVVACKYQIFFIKIENTHLSPEKVEIAFPYVDGVPQKVLREAMSIARHLDDKMPEISMDISYDEDQTIGCSVSNEEYDRIIDTYEYFKVEAEKRPGETTLGELRDFYHNAWLSIRKDNYYPIEVVNQQFLYKCVLKIHEASVPIVKDRIRKNFSKYGSSFMNEVIETAYRLKDSKKRTTQQVIPIQFASRPTLVVKDKPVSRKIWQFDELTTIELFKVARKSEDLGKNVTDVNNIENYANPIRIAYDKSQNKQHFLQLVKDIGKTEKKRSFSMAWNTLSATEAKLILDKIGASSPVDIEKYNQVYLTKHILDDGFALTMKKLTLGGLQYTTEIDEIKKSLPIKKQDLFDNAEFVRRAVQAGQPDVPEFVLSFAHNWQEAIFFLFDKKVQLLKSNQSSIKNFCKSFDKCKGLKDQALTDCIELVKTNKFNKPIGEEEKFSKDLFSPKPQAKNKGANKGNNKKQTQKDDEPAKPSGEAKAKSSRGNKRSRKPKVETEAPEVRTEPKPESDGGINKPPKITSRKTDNKVRVPKNENTDKVLIDGNSYTRSYLSKLCQENKGKTLQFEKSSITQEFLQRALNENWTRVVSKFVNDS
jgi:hypothetical protein